MSFKVVRIIVCDRPGCPNCDIVQGEDGDIFKDGKWFEYTSQTTAPGKVIHICCECRNQHGDALPGSASSAD